MITWLHLLPYKEIVYNLSTDYKTSYKYHKYIIRLDCKINYFAWPSSFYLLVNPCILFSNHTYYNTKISYDRHIDLDSMEFKSSVLYLTPTAVQQTFRLPGNCEDNLQMQYMKWYYLKLERNLICIKWY